MSEFFGFFILLMSNGILIGLMYSLIALGFVLVYKATDAVNFAQGEFVMIAGFMAAGGLMVWGAPLWVAVLVALAAMMAFGFGLERVMLRRLIGRPVIAVVMATIGLASILRGLGPFTIFSGTKPLPLPIPDEPFILGPLFIPPIQLVGGLVSLGFLVAFGWFFLKSRKGIAMRAVADNQQVAMAMGIDVERYFGLAWAMTGIVSALGGILWGNLLGVDINLALVGFKVFPVVILGGLDSIPGAIVGGLIVGLVENVAAGYVDPYVGGGTKDFAPYVLMIVALMIRPYGIFGKRIIERVRPREPRARSHRGPAGGGAVRPRGTRPHGPSWLGSIRAQCARGWRGGNGSHDPSPRRPPVRPARAAHGVVHDSQGVRGAEDELRGGHGALSAADRALDRGRHRGAHV